MKHILVPTDFSLQSLSVVHEIVSQEREPVRIHFFHLVLMPNDLSDLLYSRKSHLHAKVPASFTEALQLLQHKYTRQVEKIDFNFYYGCSVSTINCIAENNKTDKLYLLADYAYQLPLRTSVNIQPLLRKCKLPKQTVPVQQKVFRQSQPDALSVLLKNQIDGVQYSRQQTEEIYN